MKKVALTMFLAALALALFPCLGAAAGPSGLQMSIVPADALWVLHLDMEKLVSSSLFKMLMEDGRGIDVQKKMGEFSEKFKMDPFKDIKAVTVFGRGEAGEEPVIAISGNFQKDQLLGLLKADSSYKETPYGKYTLSSWDGEHFGVFVNDNLALITEKEADIKSALDAIEGKTKNVSASPLVARLQKESAGAIVAFAVADIAGLTGGGKGAAASHEVPAMLAKMQSASGAISETGDKLNLKTEITAASAQVAKDIEQAAQGLIALVNLQFTDSDAQLLTRGIIIKLDGERVRIDASYPVPELTKIIQEHKDRKEAAPGTENKF